MRTDNWLDWRFLVTLVASLAGVLVPVWLWQVDLSSKSIGVKLMSTTELQPSESAAVDGIQVSLAGKVIDQPYLSVLSLSNTGSKPIPASDFESPIEISTKNAKIVKAQVASVEPLDLKPILSLTESIVTVQPLLLNPSDNVRIAVLTSGTGPTFVARSRIAGVPSIVVSDSVGTRAIKRYWTKMVVGTLLMSVYTVLLAEVVVAMLRRRTFLLLPSVGAMVCCLGGIILLAPDGVDWRAFKTDLLAPLALSLILSLPIVFRRFRVYLSA